MTIQTDFPFKAWTIFLLLDNFVLALPTKFFECRNVFECKEKSIWIFWDTSPQHDIIICINHLGKKYISIGLCLQILVCHFSRHLLFKHIFAVFSNEFL